MTTEFSAPTEQVQEAGESESLIDELRDDSLTPIQDYRLIMLALDRGMSKPDVANAQGICIHHLRFKMRLLGKISKRVAALFEDVRITNPTLDVLGRMTERRQVEVAKAMIATGNYSCEFAKALLAATPQSGLVKPKTVSGITPKQMAEMNRDMKALRHDMQQISSSYGNDMLTLATAAAYLKKLISNREIEGYLGSRHPELLKGFREIVASTSVELR